MILGLGHKLDLRGPPAPVLLALVDLVQDIDVLLPVLARGRAEGVFSPRIVVSRWLLRESPRVPLLLRRHGLAFRTVRRREIVEGGAPGLSGVGAVLTASESSAEAHTAGHALARRAAKAGIAAYTLQHGLENVGLTGADEACFASGHVFCWFPPERTPPTISPDTRAKLIHTGRPRLPLSQAAPLYDLAVFENLHAERYGEAEREAFLSRLLATLKACPDLRICVRTHPAGAWLDARAGLFEAMANVDFVSGERARREPEGAAETAARSRRVITIPSTVALDAAQAGRRTALATAGGPLFEPLRVLDDAADWIGFARGEAQDEGAGQARLAAFLNANLVENDACGAILERLKRDLARV